MGLAQLVLFGDRPVVALPSSFIRSKSLSLMAALKSSTVFLSSVGSILSLSARPSMLSDCSGSWSVVS